MLAFDFEGGRCQSNGARGSATVISSSSKRTSHGRLHRGDGGDKSPRFEIPEGCPPEFAIFEENIVHVFKIFRFSNILKIKWLKSEEKSEFGGRWL